MNTKRLTQDKIVYFFNYVFLLLLLAVVLYPIIYIISCSFSSGDALIAGKVRFLPVGFSLDSYDAVFKYPDIWRGYLNSVVYTVVGTAFSLVITLLAAYPLSRDDFRGGKIISFLFIFTMMFSGGLVPTYLLVKNLGLLDSMWAIVFTGAINAYNIIIARTFFKHSIPQELLEASQIDGCTDFGFFTKVVLPLSKPIIAVLCLWIAVGFWNSYFSSLIYLNTESKYPLQMVLRRILIMSQVDLNVAGSSIDPQKLLENQYLSEMLKYATIIISSIPLMVVYPFIQKHFTKGVLIGAVKG